MKGLYMADLPTLKESERFVLGIFKKYNVRADETLPKRIVQASLNTPGRFRAEDVISGIESLKAKGMIEEVNGKYKLTEAGFEAM